MLFARPEALRTICCFINLYASASWWKLRLLCPTSHLYSFMRGQQDLDIVIVMSLVTSRSQSQNRVVAYVQAHPVSLTADQVAGGAAGMSHGAHMSHSQGQNPSQFSQARTHPLLELVVSTCVQFVQALLY